jgi:hypothetical protein
MDGTDVVLPDRSLLLARDPRVRSILTDPDSYFAVARRRAWPQARADVEAELGYRRAWRNGNHRLRRRPPVTS